MALPFFFRENAPVAVDPKDPGICRVTAVTTHPPAGDKVRIRLAIPATNWNGRFVAVGYAFGSTDTGHEGGSGSFALDANGRLNWQLIRDNAHLGIHEMTVTGKALTQAMDGVAPRYSCFNGCSTGGRQGLMEAERYPEDYNGIVSGAPAINWTRFLPQELRGAVEMNAAANAVAPCKLAAATAAAITACDRIDGVKDGVIEDPKRCNYDPSSHRHFSRRLRRLHRGRCEPDPEVLGRPASRGRKLPVVWDGARRGPECPIRQQGNSLEAAGVWHLTRLVQILPRAKSAAGLDHHHARCL